MLGARKNPSPSTASRPSATSVAPASWLAPIWPASACLRSARMTGPMSVSGWVPGPTLSRPAWSASSFTSTSPIGPTPTATLPARQRWPALPNAEETSAGTDASRSASSITSRWFLAPPSAWTRLRAAAPAV
jgi:hypothetical protein